MSKITIHEDGTVTERRPSEAGATVFPESTCGQMLETLQEQQNLQTIVEEAD